MVGVSWSREAGSAHAHCCIGPALTRVNQSEELFTRQSLKMESTGDQHTHTHTHTHTLNKKWVEGPLPPNPRGLRSGAQRAAADQNILGQRCPSLQSCRLLRDPVPRRARRHPRRAGVPNHLQSCGGRHHPRVGAAPHHPPHPARRDPHAHRDLLRGRRAHRVPQHQDPPNGRRPPDRPLRSRGTPNKQGWGVCVCVLGGASFCLVELVLSGRMSSYLKKRVLCRALKKFVRQGTSWSQKAGLARTTKNCLDAGSARTRRPLLTILMSLAQCLRKLTVDLCSLLWK